MMTELNDAIARHTAVQAAYDAAVATCNEDADVRRAREEAVYLRLCEEASNALNKLAETPCASDAKFLDKLKYLVAREKRREGVLNGALIDADTEFTPITIAVATHLGVNLEDAAA